MKRKQVKMALAALLALTAITAIGLIFSQPIDTVEKEKVNATFQADNKTTWATLEVADTKKKREIGLMNQTELGKHQGMVFIFPDEDMRGFWMKNTLIPLDMIFLDENKEVINVETAYPEPNTSEQNLEIYRSERPAKYVIELNAGFADNYSISEGSKVTWNN